jgi:hypothetical protein
MVYLCFAPDGTKTRQSFLGSFPLRNIGYQLFFVGFTLMTPISSS